MVMLDRPPNTSKADMLKRKGANAGSGFIAVHRLVGLVVQASASRAKYPGFESRLRRDFSGVESYQ